MSQSSSSSATSPQQKHRKPPHYERSDETRVVVTGMGAVTPLGLDVESTWAQLLAGESGITAITHFDATDYRAQIAGVVKDFDPSKFMSAKDARRYDKFMHYAVAATSMALHDAGYVDTISSEDAPVKGLINSVLG